MIPRSEKAFVSEHETESLFRYCIDTAALICTGMLIMVFNYGQRYDAIVKNITAANQYSLAFKEDIDYAMYRIVIGALKMLKNWTIIRILRTLIK